MSSAFLRRWRCAADCPAGRPKRWRPRSRQSRCIVASCRRLTAATCSTIVVLFLRKDADRTLEGQSMATDSQFLATGGSNVETGVLAFGNPGFALEVGVVGLGGQFGVTGGIDDGLHNPFIGLPARASYSLSSAVGGGASKVPGVSGVSGTSVGVFGQSGNVTGVPTG